MAPKTLNQLLAENLTREMERKKLGDNALGALAKVSPRTIANYKKDAAPVGTRGKERSAKLAEVELIAKALGIRPVELLLDHADLKRRADQVAAALVRQMPTLDTALLVGEPMIDNPRGAEPLRVTSPAPTAAPDRRVRRAPRKQTGKARAET